MASKKVTMPIENRTSPHSRTAACQLAGLVTEHARVLGDDVEPFTLVKTEFVAQDLVVESNVIGCVDNGQKHCDVAPRCGHRCLLCRIALAELLPKRLDRLQLYSGVEEL